MSMLKKLFIITALMSPALLVAACCNNNSNNCNDCCNNNGCDDCCGTDLTACCGGGIITNKTIYIDIGIGQSGTYLHEAFFRNNRMDLAEDGWRGAFQIVGFGGRTSDEGRAGLGRRFGLNGKRCMSVVEGDNTNSTQCIQGEVCTLDIGGNSSSALVRGRDIDPSHFNLRTVNGNYQATICFCPKESIGGALLSWKQGFGCPNDCGTTRWWFEINAPIVHTEHTMNLVETRAEGVETGGAVNANGLNDAPIVGTMTEAFCQPSWNYGKICGCMCETELANLEVKLGINNTISDCCDSAFYIGFAAPTSADRCGRFVFEPVIGQDHWAFMWGSMWDVCFCEWGASSLYAYLAIDARWWFQNNEVRSFDLVGKPWSRYQEMYANLEQARAANALAGNAAIFAGQAGINLMTKCVDVTPGYQVNMNTALVYKGCNFMVEVGHTMYARQGEHICPNWTVGPVLKAASGDGNVNAARTIADQFPLSQDSFDTFATTTNFEDNQIQKCDVDWNSGAHEGLIANTVYGSIGYENLDWCYPTFISFGGAFDFQSQDEGTSVQRRWILFGKVGFSF
jgi:hypothetical protein